MTSTATPDSAPLDASRLALSVVSHRQGPLVRLLLDDLRPVVLAGARLIVTINVPEDESFLAGLDFPFVILRNGRPLGFGANHNQAFRHAGRAERFVVLNPDIRCSPAVFAPLLSASDVPGVGLCAPRVLSAGGWVEDSARRHPTMRRIAKRVVTRLKGERTLPDYRLHGDEPIAVDWVAGMFVVFSAAVYADVGGFDERYFMYLEDADICRRIHLRGHRVLLLPQVDVVHDARRATSSSLVHLRWHVASLFRYLWRFRAL
jgi:GT2 family glycosyltransferase